MSLAVVVTGSRNWRDEYSVKRELLERNPDMVMHGGCPSGADEIADRWAKATGIMVVRFDADWEKYGAAAGPRRNRDMIDAALALPMAMLIAFGSGRGTDGTVNYAMKRGMIVKRINGRYFEEPK